MDNLSPDYRKIQVEELKEQLAEAILDKGSENPIHTYHVPKDVFIEMAILFIAKHSK